MRALWRPIRSKPWLSAIIAAVLVVAIGGGVFWWNGRGSKAAAATTYRLVAASTGTIRQSLSSSGTVEPAVQDELTFAVSGQITSVRVKAGQKVVAGAVLATVDSATLQANLAQAQASLASAQARVDADSSASDTQLAADNASRTAAQGQVSSAQTALSEANLTSPIAGVVASVDYTVGQQVSGSSSSGSGSGSGGGLGSGTGNATSNSNTSTSSSSTGIEVISDTSWIVNATVDDTQVGLLAVGDQAEISGASSTSTTGTTAATGPGAASGTGGGGSNLIYGTISSIGLIASSTSGVASYPVVVKVTGSPTGLHAGATATVSLIYKQLANVLTVPSTAVHQVNGKSVVYEMSGGKQVAHTVTTGLSSGGTTQITAGLTEGTQVVVEIPQVANRTGGNSGTTNRIGRTGFGGGTGGFGGGTGFGGGGGNFTGGGGLGGGTGGGGFTGGGTGTGNR